MRKFLLLALLIPVIALAAGPVKSKDPGTPNSVGVAGEVAIAGPNPGRLRWQIFCHADNTSVCRVRKAATAGSNMGFVLEPGFAYTESGPDVYSGPVAVAASAGTILYQTQED